MKKSFVISVQSTSFDAVGMRVNLREDLKKLAVLGYDGVELAIRNPEEVNKKELIQLCRESGLEIAAIGTGQAWSDEGLSITDKAQDKREKAIKRLKSHIDFSYETRAPIIIGLIRGANSRMRMEDRINLLVSGLQDCADYALKNSGVSLVIEPLNRYETNLINTINEAVMIAKRVNRSNMKVMADTFHMNIEEADMCCSIRKHIDHVVHVHFADSNRWVPGYGHLDFKNIIETLKEVDYQGYISTEILPKPNPKTCADETINYLRQLGL